MFELTNLQIVTLSVALALCPLRLQITTVYILPWIRAVLDGLLAILPPFVAVIEHLVVRPHPERNSVRPPRPLTRHSRRTPGNTHVQTMKRARGRVMRLDPRGIKAAGVRILQTKSAPRVCWGRSIDLDIYEMKLT